MGKGRIQMSKVSRNWDQDLPFEARQQRETFARFGLAVFQAQCVERQVGILLATTLNPDFLRGSPEERERFFEVEFSKTLGPLVRALGEKLTLDPNLHFRMQRALELRNWLAHRYFWERPGSILTDTGREKMILELQKAADFLGELDVELTALSEDWLDRIKFPRHKIQEEMEKYGRGEDS